MMAELLRQSFTFADQLRFARLSGDHNPIHVDPLAARRTAGGRPVVHGLHLLLRGMDALAASVAGLPPVVRIQAKFNKPVLVGDTVSFVLASQSADACALRLQIDGETVARLSFGFGAGVEPTPMLVNQVTPPLRPVAAATPSQSDIASLSGRIALPGDAAEITAMFPGAARLWPVASLRAVLATTTLVGMVCPGLHSLFAALALHLGSTPGDAEALGYRVSNADIRTRLVQMEVAGSGVRGTLDSFRRVPPVEMPDMASLAERVAPGVYAGATALVVGASRGLGELTAKLLAAGGAQVIGTYATGATDAARVAAEIQAVGGLCSMLAYDVRQPPGPQLGQARPTHLYYFATPPIFRHTGGVFSRTRLDEFLAFYVSGFHDLLLHLRDAAEAGVAAFYPSSVAVEQRPPEMTEYAMAKAAGEILCADLSRFIPKLRIVTQRLPRLPTDQTTSLIETRFDDPVSVLLPCIDAVQRR